MVGDMCLQTWMLVSLIAIEVAILVRVVSQ